MRGEELLKDTHGIPVPLWLWEVLEKAVPADTGERWAEGTLSLDRGDGVEIKTEFLALWEVDSGAVTVSQTQAYSRVRGGFRQIEILPTDPRLREAEWIPEPGDPEIKREETE